MQARTGARSQLRVAGTPLVDASRFDGVLFDLDGVLTATAQIHAASWKRTFDEFLTDWGDIHGVAAPAFSVEVDYPSLVDGRTREDGVRAFLRSRDIEVPEGAIDAPATDWSIRGISRRKQQYVDEMLRTDGVEAFPGSVAWLREMRAAGLSTAVVTSSRNASAVLDAAGIIDLLDAQVDGTTVATLGLAGKPAPDAFLEAARRLAVAPERAVVVEDARAGVRAGRAGEFGLVVGVDRTGHAADLCAAGADVVVRDLAELLTTDPGAARPTESRAHRRRARGARVLAGDDAFPVESHRIVERNFDAEHVSQLEAIFALSNGYLGVRGTHDEGTPVHAPGTLLNGFHETWPIVYPETAYGLATTGQTIAAVPDGTVVRLDVDGETLDLSRVEILAYERALDMRAGTLERTVTWRRADGCRFTLRTRRLVSLEHKHLASIEYEVTALDRAAHLTIVSELALPRDEVPTDGEPDDPRRAPALGAEVLEPVASEVDRSRVVLAMRTRASRLGMACGMDHELVADFQPARAASIVGPHDARVEYRLAATPDRPVRLVKYLAYHYADETRTPDELCFRANETLDRARAEGFARIRRTQRERLDRSWADSDVVVEGSPRLQQAVRFSVFQLIQASARVEGHGIPAKGLTGRGYEGQYFWDTEIYVQPFLTYTAPHVARALLRHRYDMLDAARDRARTLGHPGALYPWRTIEGEEASAQYAAGTAQYHINADVAYSLARYARISGDRDVYACFGGEMLVETARFWSDLGFFSDRKGGAFVINGVTGPDEYSTVVDNNTYTNLMARENLLRAADVADAMAAAAPEAFERLRERTGLTEGEPARWRRAAARMYVPFDDEAGVHLQDDGFLDRKPWDFEATPSDHYPLLLHYHPLEIYRHQVIKQADVVLATFLLDDAFTADEKRRIFEYYDPITTGDSSLSESIQSIMAAEIGDARAAAEYLVDAATIDLSDTAGNVRDGIHVASAGGTWLALVFGFGGLRDRSAEPAFAPQLPQRVTRLCFSLLVRGSRLRVDIRDETVTYLVTSGPRLEIRHHDERLDLAPGAPVVRALASGADGARLTDVA